MVTVTATATGNSIESVAEIRAVQHYRKGLQFICYFTEQICVGKMDTKQLSPKWQVGTMPSSILTQLDRTEQSTLLLLLLRIRPCMHACVRAWVCSRVRAGVVVSQRGMQQKPSLGYSVHSV